MKTVTVDQLIAAPPARVWEVVTDLDSAATTLRGVSRIERVAGEGYAPGVVWRETRTVFGMEETEEMTVAEAEAPHRTVLTAASRGAVYRTEITLHEAGAGTRLTMTFAGASESTGLRALAERITAPLGAAVTRRMLRADLADLARAAEGA